MEERPAAGALLLGIDVGTSRTKAVLVDAAGREAASTAVVTPFVTRDGGVKGGRVEMDVTALRQCLAEVVAGLGERRRRVAAVGLAGMAESGAPLDASGRPLSPVVAWHDGRGEEAVTLLERRFGPGLAHRIGQPVRTVLTVSKLGWLLRHGIGRVERWLGVPELGLHALTGAEATEFSLAARTGCYDVARREWMPEVAQALGFSVEIFAPVRAAGTVMGRISPDGAAWSGLPPGVPVTVAGHDHLVGMAGAGVGRGDVANSVGTAETLAARAATLPDLATALARRVGVTVHPGGREWAALAGAARAGLVLTTAASALARAPAELDRLAAESSAAGSSSVADVTVAMDDLSRGDASSLPDASPGAIWAGLLRALTARTVDAYGRLTEVVGRADRVVVFGGGGATEPWLGTKSAALPVRVVPSPVTSAVARGAALHAGVAAGWWSSLDVAG